MGMAGCDKRAVCRQVSADLMLSALLTCVSADILLSALPTCVSADSPLATQVQPDRVPTLPWWVNWANPLYREIRPGLG